MKLLDILKNLKDRIFGIKTKQLSEGNELVSEASTSTHDEFVSSVQLSPQEQAEQNSKLAKTAAYNCLANMVANLQFDDKKFFGDSLQKSQFRLQLEESYKNYGHGSEVSESMVPENHIKVAREIQRSLSERTKFVDGYGLMQDTDFTNFLGKNKIDLENILAKNNGAFLEQISNRFMSTGHSFIDFNTMDTRVSAIDSMHQSIMQTFEAHVQEQQYDRI